MSSNPVTSMQGRWAALERGAGARVLLAMSGGVDSAVSAMRLRDAGYDVLGLTMKNYCYGDAAVPDRSCCSIESIDDARGVCDTLGIRHMVVSTEELFGAEVFDNFVSEYRDGRTPNPCVRCNSIVRFDTLADYAARLGADLVATGHYARVFEREDGRRYLARAAYRAKDQSYFLSGLSHEALGKVLFPLGDRTKPEVRGDARDAGLDIAGKPESQEVCFMPDGTLREFLDGRVDMRPGDIENVDGEVVGTHSGLAAYTVGQRRGLGVSAPQPLYVVRMERERNVLVVGYDDALFERALTCRLGWLDAGAEGAGAGITAQIRSRQEAQPVVSIKRAQDTAAVVFEDAQRAVAPGQTIAFYDGDVVVGSGVIETAGS
jgi:tRNA-specific 2-thiouridylase